MTYLASSCFNFSNLDDLLKFCRENKFFHLELTSNLQGSNLNQPEFSFLIHNYFPQPKANFVLNLASTDENIRQKSLSHCRRAIKLCQEFSLPFYSVHAGFLFEARPQDLGQKQTDLPRIKRARGLKIFRDSINQLLALKFPLLIENNVNSQENLVDGKNQLYLLAEPKETVEFLQDVNDPHLGLLVDLGHLNVSAKQLKFDKYSYLEKLRPWIKAFHISTNDGNSDQGRPFTKDEWFIEPLKQFPDAVKIIEVDKKYPINVLTDCVKIIDNL